MIGWHHRLDGHEFGWTPGIDDGQGGPACYSAWGRKDSDTIEGPNTTHSTCEAPVSPHFTNTYFLFFK